MVLQDTTQTTKVPPGAPLKPVCHTAGKLARISHTVTAEGFGGSVGAEFLPRNGVEHEQAALRPCFEGPE